MIQQLQAHFGDGLRFIFRNFPMSRLHRHAEAAAQAAEFASKPWQILAPCTTCCLRISRA